MKKLLAIMMALVMCCSLVVSASAADTYSGIGFDITIDVDGEWEDWGDGYYSFETEDGSCLEVLVYTEADLSGYTTEEAYEEFLNAAYEAVDSMEEDEVGEFAEGKIAGYDAFILEEIYDDYTASMIFICANNYVFQLGVEGNGDDDVYNALCDAVLDITIVEDADVDVDVDDEDEDYEDEDEDVDVDVEEDEDVDADEDADDEDDKESSKEDKEDKDDKDEDEDEDEEKDNTTLIIIIVAGVAVVAFAAVVIVLVSKKKK